MLTPVASGLYKRTKATGSKGSAEAGMPPPLGRRVPSVQNGLISNESPLAKPGMLATRFRDPVLEVLICSHLPFAVPEVTKRKCAPVMGVMPGAVTVVLLTVVDGHTRVEARCIGTPRRWSDLALTLCVT